MSKQKPIFSGEDSERLWEYINETDRVHRRESVHDAFYSLGCKCQELEAVVQKQQAQINDLFLRIDDLECPSVPDPRSLPQ